jgi:hypothetical protein
MDTITEIIDKRKKAAELEDKEMEENYRKNGLYPTKYEKRLTMNEKHLFQFGEITHLWKFLFINKDIIFSIQKWNLYNKLAKITIEKKNIQKDFGSSFRMDQQI